MDYNALAIIVFWGAIVILLVFALAGAIWMTYWFCVGVGRFLRWCVVETYHPRRR